jgi:NADH:ubiquinone oxidoreductase subunit K
MIVIRILCGISAVYFLVAFVLYCVGLYEVSDIKVGVLILMALLLMLRGAMEE